MTAVPTGPPDVHAVPRSPLLAGAAVGVPGLGYVALVLLPWLADAPFVLGAGRGVGFLVSVLAFTGALVALAVSGVALVRGAQRSGRTEAWLLVGATALLVVGWFLTPVAQALLVAQVD
ncbi:hypothetical protein [Modestobacter sp. Leaf380]|uniref:hypothetical protein n=1 Tax=Modestobacter sp. Leaf380 TaxID=1736356 RepID=UPI0007015DD4|nr:hypothetical protein [Modestobacter sp. Leaf380]KQS66036.1 hypothetical protein ASG41_11690 [Modestobacter sp. Leaf380]